MAKRLLQRDILRRIKKVAQARERESSDFARLLTLAGLDPRTDLRYENWSGVSFKGLDLRDYDLSGAMLHGCDFTGSRLSVTDQTIQKRIDAGEDRAVVYRTSRFDARWNCRIDQAELGRVLYRAAHDSGMSTETTSVAKLRDAVDWRDFADPRNWTGPRNRLDDVHLRNGAIFHDAPFAPQMVVVPTGTCAVIEEHPQREVTITYRLAVARFPVTREEWLACYVDGGTPHRPPNGLGRLPMTEVSWNDIVDDYLPWLNRKLVLSGNAKYRLLSESEWEYCCRSGSRPSGRAGSPRGRRGYGPDEVGRDPPNEFGLHDMDDNVWEWCSDPWHVNYNGGPVDGSVFEISGDQSQRVARGRSFGNWEYYGAHRNSVRPEQRNSKIGFRVARTLASEGSP